MESAHFVAASAEVEYTASRFMWCQRGFWNWISLFSQHFFVKGGHPFVSCTNWTLHLVKHLFFCFLSQFDSTERQSKNNNEAFPDHYLLFCLFSQWNALIISCLCMSLWTTLVPQIQPFILLLGKSKRCRRSWITHEISGIGLLFNDCLAGTALYLSPVFPFITFWWMRNKFKEEVSLPSPQKESNLVLAALKMSFSCRGLPETAP